MKIRVFLCMAIGVGAAAASVAGQSQPKNFSIDPWHINVPKPVANPVTSITERIPGSNAVGRDHLRRDGRRCYARQSP